MALFYGGATQLPRQLKGLLLPGLPRGQIPTRAVSGRGIVSPSPGRPLPALPVRPC